MKMQHDFRRQGTEDTWISANWDAINEHAVVSISYALDKKAMDGDTYMRGKDFNIGKGADLMRTRSLQIPIHIWLFWIDGR